LCGDATFGADVARLLSGAKPFMMVTDPPYGVAYDPAWRVEAGVNHNTKKLGKVKNDDRADWTDTWRLFPGSVAYVWHGGLKANVVQNSLESCGFTMRAQIIWAKDRLALSRGDYHWQHEPCWYAVREGATGDRNKDRSQTTLWRIAAGLVSTVWEIAAREDDGHTHGTQKPVECMARPMRNHVALDVFDPFVGSGTSLIAAETLSRRCYAIEIEPMYVQVAIDRWEQFNPNGQKAVKVGEAVRA
jgi:DNA modification methylase